jgi:hypothetical protein
VPVNTMGSNEPSADDSEHDAVEYDHKNASKPNPEILGNDTFNRVLWKDPTP